MTGFNSHHHWTSRGFQEVGRINFVKIFGGSIHCLPEAPRFDLIIDLIGEAPQTLHLVTGNYEAHQTLPVDLLLLAPPPAILSVNWHDGGACRLPLSWWLLLLEHIRSMPEGSRVAVGCMGGIGRTGTALAILFALDRCNRTKKQRGSADPVKWVRRAYTPDAVEGPEQIVYVEEITGCVSTETSWGVETYPRETRGNLEYGTQPKGRARTLPI